MNISFFLFGEVSSKIYEFKPVVTEIQPGQKAKDEQEDQKTKQ